jgi:2-amino-4-hydroxy-6-hydroxymethyldihydropteridine diphosphokinase
MDDLRRHTISAPRRWPSSRHRAARYSSRLTTAYLALGSNLGDRLALLRAAVAALAADDLRVAAVSAVFESEAVADEPQPPYLDAVVRVETTLAPRDLLARCLAIEAALGRQRRTGRRWEPRLIDIDLLLFAGAVVDHPDLVVPHPRLLERPFVRVPLAEVATPGLRHPLTGERLDRAPIDPGVRPHGALSP